MTNESNLEWEARWARPAGLAAFSAAVALIAQVGLSQAVVENRPRVEPLPDFLLSVDGRSGLFLASGVVGAIGALLLLFVFLYLFRAIFNRQAAIPGWFIYLIYTGPVIFAIAAVLGTIQRIDLAGDFAAGMPIAGPAGEDRADRLLEDNPNGLVFGLGFAGSIAVAFLFVMLPLRARRVGLLTPFMSILGVLSGALLVLQIVPLVHTIIQAFWLGALGALYLGNWPGGRGPAWESGRPEPWLTGAQRRALAQQPEPEEPAPEGEPAGVPEGESEPDAERPTPRKRKRKRR